MRSRFTFGTNDSNANDRYWYVLLDGVELSDSPATETDQIFHMVVKSRKTLQRILKVPCSEYSSFECIVSDDFIDLPPIVKGKSVYWVFGGQRYATPPAVILRFRIDPFNWTKPWPIQAFIDMVATTLSEASPPGKWAETKGFNRNGFDFEVTFPIQNVVETLGQVADTATAILRSALISAEIGFDDPVSNNALIAHFAFHEQVSTACQQYLVYFAQFLRDLGIEVDTEVKTDLHRVLFKVTPRSGVEGLAKIHEALTIYLRLPGAPDFEAESARRSDPAVAQLRSNVLHLQSQLAMATATLQAKDATIQTLTVLNDHYRGTTPTTPPNSKQIDGSTKEAPETLFEGVVTLTKYEGKGFRVDVAELFRRLRRRLVKPVNQEGIDR